MVDISSAVMTTMIGMLGVVIGAIISNYFNQKIAGQAARKDVIFRKKMEYFEDIVKSINSNRKLYTASLKKTLKNSSKKEIAKILEEMKKGRHKFNVMTSPLYLDTSKISEMIRQFVNLEKLIFGFYEALKREGDNEEGIKEIGNNLRKLDIIGERIINLLRANLLKE